MYEGQDVMPSDWRYREDLIWLMYGFKDIAANWKVKLEVQQRKDRKHRQDKEKERKGGKWSTDQNYYSTLFSHAHLNLNIFAT